MAHGRKATYDRAVTPCRGKPNYAGYVGGTILEQARASSSDDARRPGAAAHPAHGRSRFPDLLPFSQRVGGRSATLLHPIYGRAT